LKRYTDWPSAYKAIADLCVSSEYSMSDFLDEIFQAAGVSEVPCMQFFFTKKASKSMYIQSFQQLTKIPQWLRYYSDRWMDVY